jgi:hypothetical protein
LLDFGLGFYTTLNSQQAIEFAQKSAFRNNSENAVASIYEIDEAAAYSQCKVLKFDTPSDDWFNFIEHNRTKGETASDYDIVFGPVATIQYIRCLDYMRAEY